MRVVFMGTPDFSVPVLSATLARGHDVVAVYSRAPRPAGRGMALRPSPVHKLAEERGIAVLTPSSLRGEDAAATFRAHEADVAVVVAYGLILPPDILGAPRCGCLNLHASLLPRWRGAAPIQRAIMAGDSETGVMVMCMEAGLDTGPVGLTERVTINAETTAGELHDRLAPIGAELMACALDRLADGTLTFAPQAEEGVTYAHKIDKLESRIEWSRPAPVLHDHVRGLSPFPGAHFEADLGKGPERVKVLRARRLDEAAGAPGTVLDDALTVACGEGALQLETVQRAGKGPMAVADFLRGARLPAGTRLG